MTSARPSERAQMRVGDADRQQMADRLTRAHALGQLDLAEFDSRVQRAWSAKVRADLDELVQDLPADRFGSAHRASSDDVIDEEGRPSGRPHGRSSRYRGVPPFAYGGGPAQWRANATTYARDSRAPWNNSRVPRAVWIALAIVAAVWIVGPLLGFVFRTVFLVAIVAGIVALVSKFRDRRHR